MNILYLSPFVPDVRASHAGGVHMGKVVETLKKHHNVYVLTFCNNQYEEKLLQDHPDFRYVKTTLLSSLATVLLHINLPNMFALRSGSVFRQMVCKTIEENNIDAVHAEYTAMGQYVWIKEKYPHIRFNLVSHDVVIQSYERQLRKKNGLMKIWASIECKKVKYYEEKYLNMADLIFVLNEKDKKMVQSYYDIDHVQTIHPYYGIDLNMPLGKIRKEKAICFVGQMGRDENHIAAMRLIRIFREINDPNWKLNIIGAYPKDELKNEESDYIHISGFIEDINQEIMKNEIAVFPLTYGAGIKFKVLLAMGLGIPVLTTSVGAEGIDPDGKALHLAESDVEIKNELQKMMSDEQYRHSKSKASSNLIIEMFDWQYTVNVFEKVYPKNYCQKITPIIGQHYEKS